MHTFSKVIRNLSLALLSGGSAAIVFAAIVLVKAATAHGVPVAEAAATNAPIFIHYGKIALAAAVLLAVAELLDFMRSARKSKLDYLRYGCDIVCIIAVGVYALGIVPPMERLLPDIKNVKEAHEQFRQLHEFSRAVFGTSILMAFISLILPCFKKDIEKSELKASNKEEPVAL